MRKTVNLTIDGQEVEAVAGQTILEAAQEAGIEIPALCHHPALEPIGACRVCLVEVSKFQPLYPACTYRVSEGLAVETHSPRVEKARRFVLEMLFSERNHYCMYCESSGNCELQDLGYLYGLDHWVYPTYTEPFPVDATRDTFLMDHNRCILCRRCVRACAELVANHTLGMRQRGAETMICADMNLPFGESSCIGCGTCLQVCPTGALIDKRSAYMDLGRSAQIERVQSTCSQCSVGCGLEILVRGGNIVRVDGRWEASPNGGVLCKKGRFDPLYEKRQRITSPMVRRNGALEETSWQEAVGVAARRLSGTPTGKLGVLASSQATNEALYLVKTLFGNEIGASKLGLLNDTMTMLPAPHGTLDQIAHSDLVLVVNSDPARYQPVVSFLIKRAVDKGTRLIVVDGPENELAPFAQMRLEMDDLDRAIEAVRRAESPLVLYGPGLPDDIVARLQKLSGAQFLALEPGANSRAAAAFGLEAGFDGSGVEALYCLLGEQAWDGAAASKRVPDGTFLVLQASYESPLVEHADVVLPMAIWSERPGTLTNLEGHVHQAEQAVAARGQAKADWQILSLLGQELGKQPVDSLAELSRLAAQGLYEKENR